MIQSNVKSTRKARFNKSGEQSTAFSRYDSLRLSDQLSLLSKVELGIISWFEG
jgi:hypothetical protein